ncbi:hypothetical protein AAGG52_07280 [Bacillus licheniformis]
MAARRFYICLGGKKLFFRKMTEEEKKSTEKATRVGFVFYMIALSVSSAYSFFIDSRFNISFLILMVGLIVFLPVILYSIKSLIKTIIQSS